VNKSLHHRLLDLEKRISALEAKPKEPAVTIITPVVLDEIKPVEKKPKMCPKCGVKPGYFFHVRTCTGQKEEQKDADTDRRRDQGKT
jgi:hypothetical protein